MTYFILHYGYDQLQYNKQSYTIITILARYPDRRPAPTAARRSAAASWCGGSSRTCACTAAAAPSSRGGSPWTASAR